MDSNSIEAIEPDWVHTTDRLIGVYGATIDGLGRLRSVSGIQTRTGSGTSGTSTEWVYDNDGNITNKTIPQNLNYTQKDFQNLSRMRYKGAQLIDYEMSKDIANIVMALTGTRDIQSICGYGVSSGYVAGSSMLNIYGNQTLKRSGVSQNVIFGLQNFVGGNSEWLDNVVVNALSFKSFMKNKSNSATVDKVDAVWKIFNPETGQERAIKGVNSSGYTIGRTRFGRYADVICSRATNDNSLFNQWYSDTQYYTASLCRVVLRGGNNANAAGGLVSAGADYASSNSNTNYGARLAFIGNIEIE